MSNSVPKMTDSFTLDPETTELLKTIADAKYEGNKSQTVRQAIRSLAETVGIVVSTQKTGKKATAK